MELLVHLDLALDLFVLGQHPLHEVFGVQLGVRALVYVLQYVHGNGDVTKQVFAPVDFLQTAHDAVDLLV